VLVSGGGNKAESAKLLEIWRQYLYCRIERIAKLLDVDLDDPKQMVTLSVAVTARRMLSTGP
jgi:purine catabolism regulator